MLPALARIDVLQSLPPEGLAQVAQMARRRFFAPGDELMRQGELSDSIHFIIRGRVRVERSIPDSGAPLLLAELGPGECVGERGVLYAQPRLATVAAIEETETVELDTSALALIGLRYPEVAAALASLIGRRQRATEERESRARAQRSVHRPGAAE